MYQFVTGSILTKHGQKVKSASKWLKSFTLRKEIASMSKYQLAFLIRGLNTTRSASKSPYFCGNIYTENMHTCIVNTCEFFLKSNREEFLSVSNALLR